MEITEKNVWGFADKLSEVVHRRARIRAKEFQFASVTEKRCGNCYHWMKSSCKREKQFGEFKSSASAGCGEFEMCPQSDLLAAKFRGELEDLKQPAEGHGKE